MIGNLKIEAFDAKNKLYFENLSKLSTYYKLAFN
jgi:hypothetical protein